MKLLLSTLLLFGAVNIPNPAQAQWAMTCTRDVNSSVNLRRGPGQNYSIVASIPNSSSVRLYSWVWGGSDGMRWWRVENSGIVGFVRSDYLCR
jgi:uncharacterized protein YraI